MRELSSVILDLSGILNRALEVAARNLSVEKILIGLGLDPAHLTYDAVFQRLIEVALANITFANLLALTGAVFYVATLMVRTIVPLRVIGIISMVFFIAYGAAAGAVATFFASFARFSADFAVRALQGLLRAAKTAGPTPCRFLQS